MTDQGMQLNLNNNYNNAPPQQIAFNSNINNNNSEPPTYSQINNLNIDQDAPYSSTTRPMQPPVTNYSKNEANIPQIRPVVEPQIQPEPVQLTVEPPIISIPQVQPVNVVPPVNPQPVMVQPNLNQVPVNDEGEYDDDRCCACCQDECCDPESKGCFEKFLFCCGSFLNCLSWFLASSTNSRRRRSTTTSRSHSSVHVKKKAPAKGRKRRK